VTDETGSEGDPGDLSHVLDAEKGVLKLKRATSLRCRSKTSR
jgi:hypothetical protein